MCAEGGSGDLITQRPVGLCTDSGSHSAKNRSVEGHV